MKRPQPSFVFYFVQEGDGYVAQHCNPRSINQKSKKSKIANPSPFWGGSPPFENGPGSYLGHPTGDGAFASNIAGDQTRAGGHSGPHIARRLPGETLETNAPLGELTPLAEPADLLRIRHPVLSAF